MNWKEELEAILNRTRSHREFDEAIASIGRLEAEDGEKFAFLWSRATKAQSAGGHVLLAALALYKLNLPCTLTARTAVEQLCDAWDVSLEEVPWYLARQFSKETILDLCASMQFETAAQTQRLKTCAYWVEKLPTAAD